jgi:Mrp family chromosome partitioning ATPase
MLDVGAPSVMSKNETQLGHPNRRPVLEQEMMVVQQRVESLLWDLPWRIIQFTSSQRGEGTSTLVASFGRALAGAAGKSVLIIDAHEENPQQHEHFGISRAIGWNDVVAGREPVQRAIYPTVLPNLFVSPLSERVLRDPSLLDSPAFGAFLEGLRGHTDAILLDSSPVSAARSGQSLSARADGVVLVLEAENTRWPVARNAKKTIIRGGGRLLGVVLNKRRYHIPEWIYRRL